MKRWQIIVVIVTSLFTIGLAGCSTVAGGGETANQQLSEVRKGALTVSVSGSGNLEASEDAMLSFGIGGRIEKIYVEEGDQVSKGDILAKLETDALELAVTQTKLAVAEAQVNLSEAQYDAWESDLTTKLATDALELAVTQTELALTEAQVNLETAEYNLYEAKDDYVWLDIRTAQSDVDEAQRYLDETLRNLNQAPPTGPAKEHLQKAVIHAQSRLDTTKDILKAMLAGNDPQEVVIKSLEIELSQQSIEESQQSLAYTQNQLDKVTRTAPEIAAIKAQQVELTQQSVEEARQFLEQAQKNLDKATITAPFDGVVADVVPEEGDTVGSATQIIYLVDPTTMELVLKLDEMDVPGVMLNQEAIISVDSLPGITFEGRVTSIYPTPTVVGGVVLYKTEISFDVPEDSGIKVGMSAIADIIVSKKENVVLVPKQAIEKSEQEGTQVSVMVNDQIQKKPVVIGLSDGIYTEILSGVSEGESVVVNIAR